MSIVWGIMALAMAGSEPPEGPAKTSSFFTIRLVRAGGNLPVAARLVNNTGVVRAEEEQISYEVRVMDTPASEWREAFYRHCTRVGREGRSTVWTLDEKTAAELMKRQQGSPRTHVVMAPKVTAFAGASATVDTRQTRTFVVDVDRVADGPVDHSPALAYRPSVEEIREGLTVSVAGNRTAAGVRAHLKLDSTWVGHVARATTSETVENAGYGKASLEASMQLPQVVEAKVDGDYEIPSGRQVLVSLGTATTADTMGSPVVMERLLLIAARPILTEAEESRLGRKPTDAAMSRAAWLAPARSQEVFPNQTYSDVLTAGTMPKKMPPLPSRTPMEPIGPDGKVVELPPLPDDLVAEAEALESSSGPQPSPQSRTPRSLPRIDPKVAPARLEPAPSGLSPLRLDSRELASGRSQVVRIPLGGSLAIELKARLVPAEAPE